MMTLIVRQSFSNNLFGFGARRLDAADARDARLGRSSGTRAFRRDLEVTA